MPAANLSGPGPTRVFLTAGTLASMTIDDLIGAFAASLVLATFCARQMVPLRVLAIASNIAFIVYADRDGLLPILVLHAVMLPLNVLRLCQELTTSRTVVPTVRVEPCEGAEQQEGAATAITRERMHDYAAVAVWEARQPVAAVRSMLADARRLCLLWRERHRERHQLRAMSARDFGDLCVAQNLLEQESRRWPWQAPILAWNTVRIRAVDRIAP